ncbi:MAG: outer membrane lipoprotein carrier protein LolA [Firmicutes bacterium]|nr:outer membrane lipoprotein carrier protein LolA [Bacillota bacterium]
MKRIAILAISLLLVLTGCGKKTPEDLVSKFEKNVKGAKSYVVKGNMEILSNEETYTYSLEANYLKDNYYKVTLVNQTNNHEQIILKNKDGVYVVTPALNKSFKFQSEWPDNSSQSYILSSLVNDIKNDKKMSIEEKNKGYILKTKVNYPNNNNLSYQKIYFDKDMNLEKVEVYNKEDIVNIKVMFSAINLKAGLEEKDFALEDLIDINNEQENNNESENKNEQENNKETKDKETCDTDVCDTNDNEETCENEECDTKTSNILNNIIYPLYIPSETYLSNSEKIDTEEGNRVILTFAGDKNFVLIEEVANISDEFEIIPVYGEPVMLGDTIAAKSANSMYWTSEGLSYYLTSSDLSTEEMVTIAESLGNTKLVLGSK